MAVTISEKNWFVGHGNSFWRGSRADRDYETLYRWDWLTLKEVKSSQKPPKTKTALPERVRQDLDRFERLFGVFTNLARRGRKGAMQIARLRRADRAMDRTEGASVVMFAGASKSLKRGLGWGRRREADTWWPYSDITSIRFTCKW